MPTKARFQRFGRYISNLILLIVSWWGRRGAVVGKTAGRSLSQLLASLREERSRIGQATGSAWCGDLTGLPGIVWRSNR